MFVIVLLLFWGGDVGEGLLLLFSLHWIEKGSGHVRLVEHMESSGTKGMT